MQSRKYTERKEHGDAHTCIEYENAVKRSLVICVNENTNTLVRDMESFADRDIQPVGGSKVYPHFLSYVEDGKTMARVNITEIASPAQFSPNLFVPPAGVSPQPGCMNPTQPRLIKRLTPEYPQSARHQHFQDWWH